MAMPGDNVTMKIKLIYPVALEEGLRFAIRPPTPWSPSPVHGKSSRPITAGGDAVRGL
jgi:hypothetical protein